MDEPSKIGISVVIGVLNGESTLEKQLEAVLGQEASFEFEVIAVDHGSSDRTSQIISQFADVDPRLKLIEGAHLKTGGAAPKNLGVQKARSDKIAFCDADDVVQSGWLQAIYDGLQSSPVVFARFEYWLLNPRHVRSTRPQYSRNQGGGAFGIWKSIYMELGMFDEDFTGAVDTEFFFRAEKRLVSSRHLENAIVSVRLPQTCRDVFSRERKLAYSHPELEARSTRVFKAKKILFASFLGVLRSSWRIATRSGRYRFAGSLGALIGRLEGLRDQRIRKSGMRETSSDL